MSILVDIIGVGNTNRGDDAVGLHTARTLRLGDQSKIRIHEAQGDVTVLLELLRGASFVIVIDAVRSHYKAGTIFRLDASQRPLPVKFCSSSTHGLGVAECIELARSLHQLPPRVLFFGVEGELFQSGDPVTRNVEEAIPRVVESILKEVSTIEHDTIQEASAGIPTSRR
jgi:hydrogenase maturation protease